MMNIFKSVFFMQILLSASIVAQPPDTVGNIIWYPPIQLSDSAHNAAEARIALSGDDTVHVTWWYGTIGMRLPYIRSVTSGVSFESVHELLVDSISFPYGAFRPVIITRAQNVMIFFTGATASYPPIHMIRSSDAGTTWNNVVDISPDTSPEVSSGSLSNDSITLIYPSAGGERRILRSSNDGLTWSRTNEDLEYHSPRVALTSGSLHLVQRTVLPSSGEVEYRRSSNLGDSWEIDTVISDIDSWWSDYPTIAGYTSECGTELVTAWRDTKYGWYGLLGASIISRASVDNGSTWLPENVLTEEPKGIISTADIQGNVRAVGWGKEVAAADTFHGEATATNWSLTHYSDPLDLTPDVKTAGVDDIAVSSRAVHVVWHQAKEANGKFSIYYRRGEFLQKDVNFSLSTGLIEKGAVAINTTASETVTVSNSGTDTLVIGTAISTDENFTVVPAETTVAPGGSTAITVLFTPKTLGEHSGKIIFYHNGQTSPDCISVTTEVKWQEEQLAYTTGWNLVSIPLLPGPAQRLPQMFAYENGYVKRDTMHLGIGYWAKFPVDSVVTFQGVGVERDTFDLKVKWNMIGSLTVPVTVSSIQTIPDSIIVSSFYGYSSNGYFTADTLLPGRAYWVKVKQEGKMILKGTMKK